MVTSTLTAAGAAREMALARVQLPVSFMDVVQPANPHSLTIARRLMPGESVLAVTASVQPMTLSSLQRSSAYR
jgi:hypothetical protein